MESTSHQPVSKDAEDHKLIAAIGYLGILCLVPLLLAPKSPFAMHHGKQGLVILIAWIILGAGNVVPIIGWIVFMLGSVVLCIFMILGIVNALNGKMWTSPYIGQYADKIKL